MRKISVLFLLFLTCCNPVLPDVSTATIAPTANPTGSLTPVFRPIVTSTHALHPTVTPTGQREYPPSTAAFTAGKQCPSLCWLGVHPGITSTEQAIQLLENSTEISSVRLSGNEIDAAWFTSSVHEDPLGVNLAISHSVIQSIYFVLMYPFTVKDIVSLLGKPDQIRIEVVDHFEGGMGTNYMLYYAQYDAIVHILFGSKGGPAPDDSIYEMTVGIPRKDTRYFQVWLGYGDLQGYLPKAVPTPVYQPTPQGE